MLGAFEVLLPDRWYKIAPKLWKYPDGHEEVVSSYMEYPENTDKPIRFIFTEEETGYVISGPISSVLATKNTD